MQYRPRLKIYKGSNGKNTFNPETFEAKSYGWWVYVMKVKGKIIFNDYNYSVTTRQHQYEMRHFLKTELKIKDKDIIVVNQRESLSSGLKLDFLYSVLALAEMRSKKKNMRASYIKEQKQIINNCKKQITLLKKLGAKSDYSLTVIRKETITDENNRLKLQREKSKIQREKAREIKLTYKDQMSSVEAVSI